MTKKKTSGVTPYAIRQKGVVVDRPHSDLGEDTYHELVYLELRGADMPRTTEYRDFLGRRTGGSWRWSVLICNNVNCHGRVLARLGEFERLVNRLAWEAQQ